MIRLHDLLHPLTRWLPRRRACAHLQFTLYTRAGCHLCEDAWELLRREQERFGFTLTTVDVDADPRLVEQHGDCVPVVAVNGKVYFRGRVNPVLLARLLYAEAARERPGGGAT